ncbi:unnamed protein product [Blepharisma stoltei]|uniref:Cyclic nucleotide-binding domain-containing protein n=1 Tax=Blepharisma stoltei TaxID=1481888 RepID=A0AAU9J4F8_9CILI|nr:unnamed protein product [Blepharisma stoltei]
MDEPQTETNLSKENQSLINDLKTILEKSPESRTAEDINKIMGFTVNVKFFKSLTADSSSIIHRECCLCMSYEFFPANEYVFHYGDKGNKFYILLFGSVGVQVPFMNEETEQYDYQEVLVLKDGASFGELALLEKKPRAASIQCKEASHFAVLDKINYQRILSKLMNEKKQEIVNYLKTLPIFHRWTRGSLTKLSFFFEEKSFYRKHVIYKEGEEANEVYLIREGEFQFIKKIPIDQDHSNEKKFRRILIPKKAQQHRAEVAILGKGEFFGEEEVINRTKRNTTCICYSLQATVLAISATDFVRRVTSEDSWKIIKNRNEIKTDYRTKQIQNITEEVTQFIISPKKLDEEASQSLSKEDISPLARTNFRKMYDHVKNSFLFKTTEKELIKREKTTSPIKSDKSEPIIQDIKLNLQKTTNSSRPESSSLANTLRALQTQRNNRNFIEMAAFNLEEKSSRLKRRPASSSQRPCCSEVLQYDTTIDVTFHKKTPPLTPNKNASTLINRKLRGSLAENSISIFSLNSFPIYDTLWDPQKVSSKRRNSHNIHFAKRTRPPNRTLSHFGNNF